MSNNKQISSVEQLAIALYENGFLQGNGDEIDDLLLYFKAMHKKEIKEAYWNGSDGIETKTEILQIGEQYYNETFNNEQ